MRLAIASMRRTCSSSARRRPDGAGWGAGGVGVARLGAAFFTFVAMGVDHLNSRRTESDSHLGRSFRGAGLGLADGGLLARLGDAPDLARLAVMAALAQLLAEAAALEQSLEAA